MSESKGLKPGDACPRCGGELAPDLSQQSTALVDHHKRVAANPSASARYAELVEEKVRTSGELHACRDCGYQTRFEGELAAAGGGKSSRRRSSGD